MQSPDIVTLKHASRPSSSSLSAIATGQERRRHSQRVQLEEQLSRSTSRRLSNSTINVSDDPPTVNVLAPAPGVAQPTKHSRVNSNPTPTLEEHYATLLAASPHRPTGIQSPTHSSATLVTPPNTMSKARSSSSTATAIVSPFLPPVASSGNRSNIFSQPSGAHSDVASSLSTSSSGTVGVHRPSTDSSSSASPPPDRLHFDYSSPQTTWPSPPVLNLNTNYQVSHLQAHRTDSTLPDDPFQHNHCQQHHQHPTPKGHMVVKRSRSVELTHGMHPMQKRQLQQLQKQQSHQFQQQAGPTAQPLPQPSPQPHSSGHHRHQNLPMLQTDGLARVPTQHAHHDFAVPPPHPHHHPPPLRVQQAGAGQPRVSSFVTAPASTMPHQQQDRHRHSTINGRGHSHHPATPTSAHPPTLPPPSALAPPSSPRVADTSVPSNSTTSSASGSMSAPTSYPVPPTPIPPAVLQLASSALSAGQVLFEQAWRVTSSNVQTEMARMHGRYVSLLEGERKEWQWQEREREKRASERDKRERDALRAEVNRLEVELAGYRQRENAGNERESRRSLNGAKDWFVEYQQCAEDNARLVQQNRKWANDHARLLTELRGMREKDASARRVSISAAALKNDGGDSAPTGSSLGVAVRAATEDTNLRPPSTSVPDSPPLSPTALLDQFSPSLVKTIQEQLEVQFASSLAEQRVKRAEAERKLSEVQKQLRAIANASADFAQPSYGPETASVRPAAADSAAKREPLPTPPVPSMDVDLHPPALPRRTTPPSPRTSLLVPPELPPLRVIGMTAIDEKEAAPVAPFGMEAVVGTSVPALSPPVPDREEGETIGLSAEPKDVGSTGTGMDVWKTKEPNQSISPTSSGSISTSTGGSNGGSRESTGNAAAFHGGHDDDRRTWASVRARASPRSSISTVLDEDDEGRRDRGVRVREYPSAIEEAVKRERNARGERWPRKRMRLASEEGQMLKSDGNINIGGAQRDRRRRKRMKAAMGDDGGIDDGDDDDILLAGAEEYFVELCQRGPPAPLLPTGSGSKSATETTSPPNRHIQLQTPPPPPPPALPSQSPPAPLPPPPLQLPAPPPKRKKLGIHHMDLLYETIQDKMHCRMCLRRRQQGGSDHLMTFPTNASWATLIGHCESEHLGACEELEKLSPSQVVELRQRVKGMK